jgi:hypothetical protein
MLYWTPFREQTHWSIQEFMMKITKKTVRSVNSITIDHLNLACRHVDEMREVNIRENLAIRILEHWVEIYSKLYTGMSASPNSVRKIPLSHWSINARKLRAAIPSAKPQQYFRVEHGTPRRWLAKKVLELYREGKLNQRRMNNLVRRYYRVGVITLEEDARLNKMGMRSKAFARPEDRWKAAGIRF